MLSMLRWVRLRKLMMPWWVPALGWVAAGGLSVAGAEWAEERRVTVATAGLVSVVLLRRILRQMSAHNSRHRRRERQHDVMVSVTRAVYECEGRTPPPGLDDERERRAGAEVVQLRPRGAGPRHSRSRRTGA